MNKESHLYYRTMVLYAISEKVTSGPIVQKILEIIMNSPNDMKENTAKNIMETIENCQTEEEVVQALDLK